MNERYLSKAKTCNGEWVVGFLHCNENRWYISNKAGAPFAFEVRPDTICRCTESSDKNDNLIWENDIVRVWGDTDDFGNDLYYFFKVVWNKDLCCWWLSDIYTKDDECLYIYLKEIEILGNVFDNQELLEGGE